MLQGRLELHGRCFSTINWHQRIVKLCIMLVIILASIGINLDVLNTRRSFQLRSLLIFVIIGLVCTRIDRVRDECNRSILVMLLFLIVSYWWSRDLRFKNHLLMMFCHQSLIPLGRALLRDFLRIFPIEIFMLIRLTWLLLILNDHLMILIFVRLVNNVFAFTEAPLCTFLVRSPLRHLNVLPEALKE